MENNKNYLCTYKFFDIESRRLSIFAVIEDTKMRVSILPCSKKDEFSKKWARGAFEALQLGGPVMDGRTGKIIKFLEMHAEYEAGKPKASFLKFCNQNFYKIVNVEISIQEAVEISDIEVVRSYKMGGPKNLIKAKILVKNDRRKTEE